MQQCTAVETPVHGCGNQPSSSGGVLANGKGEQGGGDNVHVFLPECSSFRSWLFLFVCSFVHLFVRFVRFVRFVCLLVRFCSVVRSFICFVCLLFPSFSSPFFTSVEKV